MLVLDFSMIYVVILVRTFEVAASEFIFVRERYRRDIRQVYRMGEERNYE
jgi:hypothetical protein